MESKDNFSDGVCKAHPVLADITNRPAKRPLSLMSGDDADSQFTKQVCIGVENLVKRKCQSLFGAQDDFNTKDKDKIPLQPTNCLESENQLVSSHLDKLVSSPKPSSDESKEQNPLGVENFVGLEDKREGRLITEDAIESGDSEHCLAEKLGSTKSGAMEMPTVSASAGFKFQGLGRCSALKGDGAANFGTHGVDLKCCSCSFCSKAAYIWSDLHYQDVKGRLSAVKKSQKEASMIIQKFAGLKDTVMPDQNRSGESSKLESSLMHQWKSLFVHTENIYIQENSQLESSFGTLKDLREKCKNDLELNDNSHPDNH